MFWYLKNTNQDGTDIPEENINEAIELKSNYMMVIAKKLEAYMDKLQKKKKISF